MIKDMTVGSPAKLLVLFTIPLLIGNIFQLFYSMADMLIVGKVMGPEAFAGVSATGGLSFLIFGFFWGLTSGFAIITAQRFGANDYAGVRRSVATSTILSLMITIPVTLFCTFYARSVLEIMDTPEEVIEYAYEYIMLICAGTATLVFYNLLACVIRALGDSKTPLVFLVIAAVMNVILDIVFIKYLNMGTAGAAWATNISQFVSGLLCLIFVYFKFPILRLKKSDWILTRDFVWEHLRVAIPMALQFSITAVGILIVQKALNQFGPVIMAGFAAASRIEQIAMQPIFTFGVALATYTAQNFGAKKLNRIRKGVRVCMIILLITGFVGNLFMVVYGQHLIPLFFKEGTATPEHIYAGKIYFYLNAPFFFFLAFLLIYRNALQGIGRAFFPMLAGVMELVMRVLSVYIFAKYFGYIGVCMANPMAWIGGAILLAAVYYYIINREPFRKRRPIPVPVFDRDF